MNKKLFVSLLGFGLIVLLRAPVVRAQGFGDDEAVVKVPFQFVAGDTVLPAGVYRVTADSESPNVVWIASTDGKSVAVVDTECGGPLVTKAQPQLVFRKYGSTCFLTSINVPGDDGRLIPLTRADVAQQLAHMARARYDAAQAHRG